MSWRTAESCPECGREHDGSQLCDLCGHLFRVQEDPRRSESEGSPATAGNPPPIHELQRIPGPRAKAFDASPAEAPSPWVFLGLGLLASPLFLVHELTRYCAWFLSALAHETGHCAMGWAMGMPSVPAIRLDGHAMAMHGPQLSFLVLLFAAWLAYVMRGLGNSWHAASNASRIPWRRFLPSILVVAGYLGFVFSSWSEAAFLLGGHAGEALFACICLWRTLVGGWTSSHAERVLYGALGGYLIGNNVLLGLGLAFDAGARASYAANGSFGLTNDYLRLERDLGLPLELLGLGSAAVFLGTATLLVLAVHGARLRARAIAENPIHD